MGAVGGGGTLRTRRKAGEEGGVETALKEQRNPAAMQRRQSIRRAKSLRRVEKQEDGGQNLNNLLNMLDKMKKTETPAEEQSSLE